MKRETQNVLLLLLGIAVGIMVVKGAYLHYVKPALFAWLVIAAVGLVAMALISIVRDIRRGGTELVAGHRHRGGMVWLLLIPVVLVAFVIPPPIEATGAAPVSANPSTKHPFPPLPAGHAPSLSVPEVMMRAATDSAGTLDNRLITVTGFTMTGDGGADLGRVVIICCAADAQLARIHLTGPAAATAASYPEDTWLRVEGTAIPGSSTAASSFVPTMNVTTVTKIDRPANTYAY
jgi:putative membrane protein